MPPDSIAVPLDRERRIAFTQRALCRMSALDAPYDLGDLARPKKSYGALVAWLWACLVPADAADFATPDDLAPHVPLKAAGLLPLLQALHAAVAAATDEKKTEPAKPSGPLPA